jgi:hypothetical protein
MISWQLITAGHHAMIHVVWFLIGLAILFLWLRGHWFGWVVAFFPIFLIVQLFMSGPQGDQPDTIVWRAVAVLVVTGIPCVLWGSIRRAMFNSA